MRFYCRHWYSFNLLVAGVLAIALAFNWNRLFFTQQMVALNLLFLFIHQFEEYGWPGGEPAIMNVLLQQSDIPERFPLNQFSAMITNVVCAVVLYGLPFFFPNTMWLCLAPMLFNVLQLFIHGVATNVKLKGLYNPGLFAVVFLHMPVTVFFIYTAVSEQLLSAFDWMGAILYTLFAGGFFVGIMTYVVFANRESSWPFAEEEMERFHLRKKIEQRGIEIDTQQPSAGPIAKFQSLQRKLHEK